MRQRASKADPYVPQNLMQWEKHIHAFVSLCAEDVPKEGPLAGLTVGVKDVIDVAGVPTRNGSDAYKDAEPALQDAAVVAALRNAGARIVGKTTTTEFAFTDPTPCRNPHDLNRSPGGSSSGSGAAVAAGVVDIALGTQTAGSLCRPAAYCGVVGFKPSYGMLPTAGVTPLAASFDTVGIIASSVALAKKAFAAIAPTKISAAEPSSLKVVTGLWQTSVHVDEDALAGLHSATTALGTHIDNAPLSADVDAIVKAHRIVMNYEAAQAHGVMLQDARVDVLKPKFLAGLKAGLKISPDEAKQAADFLADAKQQFWGALAGAEIVLTLPVPEGAPLIDGTTGYQDWLTPWTVFGGPLVCLPWGPDRLGRPRSVMLAAHPGQDVQILETAAQLENRSPDLPRPQLPS
ncbi:Asp-tRNA(Asn)/Glu-tRNA(Gln) amidotransferase A subunit family amidase [Yoonia maricola]|uniref:Asp-tRNA(Asn)/Glu-tRNA(Gln) amidotransferase A subunit family amidase n=1 Tax=Yoonia maricola TaxID=420999 RepID=A0A2M8W5V5_9RHOB|nr:amidase [Yoonia maricola]PJI86303.1 Asp-tRNA(Asn)/Glu-tRNA(Gln) amidotransferase A subunit family amidase [Yoonia maricola]